MGSADDTLDLSEPVEGTVKVSMIVDEYLPLYFCIESSMGGTCDVSERISAWNTEGWPRGEAIYDYESAWYGGELYESRCHLAYDAGA